MILFPTQSTAQLFLARDFFFTLLNSAIAIEEIKKLCKNIKQATLYLQVFLSVFLKVFDYFEFEIALLKVAFLSSKLMKNDEKRLSNIHKVSKT